MRLRAVFVSTKKELGIKTVFDKRRVRAVVRPQSLIRRRLMIGLYAAQHVVIEEQRLEIRRADGFKSTFERFLSNGRRTLHTQFERIRPSRSTVHVGR
jgi:hypothetical protein